MALTLHCKALTLVASWVLSCHANADRQMQQVIDRYAAAAPELIDRYNAVSSSELFKPVIDLLSVSRLRVADIGAGPGRHAAWLASMGHIVLPIEPVKEFRDAGKAIHSLSKIEWTDDRLPDLIDAKTARTLRIGRALCRVAALGQPPAARCDAQCGRDYHTRWVGNHVAPSRAGRPGQNCSPDRSRRDNRHGIE
jgi:hypothetical protein